MLDRTLRRELLGRGFTRRDLGRIAALLTAGSTLPFFDEPALAQLSALGGRVPPGSVLLNANENPLGPCPAALEALARAARDGGRYQYYLAGELTELIAGQQGVSTDQILLGPGSAQLLHHAVLAFSSPARGLVSPDPTFEAAAGSARFSGARVTMVPLTAGSAAHDTEAMLGADPAAGLFYVCNPNNPTGSVTSRDGIARLVEKQPAGSLVLLDEAYIHFSDEPPGNGFVKAGRDVVVLRTFSKIYGMAGLRMGYAMGRADLLERMRRFSSWTLSTTALTAARASLLDGELLPSRKSANARLLAETKRFLAELGFQVTPSVANCFMVETRGDARQLVRAMAEERVYIGRSWPAWPAWARVTVGTAEEMERFRAAFRKVLERRSA